MLKGIDDESFKKYAVGGTRPLCELRNAKMFEIWVCCAPGVPKQQVENEPESGSVMGLKRSCCVTRFSCPACPKCKMP
jgi:hypothetical protein